MKDYLLNYLNNVQNIKFEGEFIYILSTREFPKTLKIGMTSRSVTQRVKEINSATGVLHPYSARKIFKVKNSKIAESEIFDVLKPFRLRPDREFFNIEFSHAISLIVKTLLHKNLISREKGVIRWYSTEKGFGFVTTDDNKDIYFHSEELINNILPIPGALVEFDIKDSSKGPKAQNIFVL
ncbi:cold shock domain-containing protein [Spirosoma gilvum]